MQLRDDGGQWVETVLGGPTALVRGVLGVVARLRSGADGLRMSAQPVGER